MGISLLIFSRNDTANALDLAKSLLGSVDQVVIVDSSDEKEHKELVEKARQHHKIEVYYTLPLGYPDLLRAYGIGKCKMEWILLLDTDERLNGEFVQNLKEVVKGTKCDAFAIKRYEEASPEGHTAFFTWQTRLFKKANAEFKGIIHEQAIVHGRLCTLGDRYFIEHRTDLMHHGSNSYGKMQLFEMLSYKQYNEIVLDYVRKFFALDTNSAKSKIVQGLFRLMLRLYEALLFKKQEQEISKRDYLWFYFIRTLAYGFRQRRLGSLAKIWKGQKDYFEYLEKERKKLAEQYGISRQDLFNIAQHLYKEGVIKYLGFDKPENVDRLTHEYLEGRLKDKGIDLTIMLIVDRYKRQYL